MASPPTEDSAATESVRRSVSRVQIYKHVTGERLLSIEDMLDIEARRSKIALGLLEFEPGYKVKARVRHYADASDFKLACWDILNGTFTEWYDYKGSPAPNASDPRTPGAEPRPEARILSLRRDYKYKLPYVLKIDNGDGEVQPDGTVRLAGAARSLTLLLGEWDARRLAQTVYDYIRDWETLHFTRRREAMTYIAP